ncbi:neural cell adhesion molecule 1-like isoform X3 [Orbicella faveolata]|uniref:neural cell adhesion molecule 1-like isoform X3 n=1 Tax=Orbicella faveolata TaxID=48498 RepID=UPI0009E5818B|nr:neural cell adhesion molecule 1-like isoform X3 [Orbicella faveolata]
MDKPTVKTTHSVFGAAMVKLLLVIGAVLAVTVSRTDGTVTLPTNTLKAQQGRDIPFQCVVTGESFVAWVTPAKPARPGKPAIPSVRIPASQTTPVNRRKISVSGDTYELTIEDLIVDDGGEYICEGSVESKVFTLQVDFETSQVVTKQELHLGRPGTITLDVSAYPPLTYDWRKDGQKLEFPMAGKTLDPYTGSISIDNVQEADEGNYTCTVKFGTADTVEIEVTTIDEPKIRKYPGGIVYRRLTQGNNATFHCDVESGHPKPEITWYFGWTDTLKKVDPLYDARFTHPTDETWLITGVQTTDKGKYRCIAKNKAGEDDLRFEITHVDVPPTIDPMTDIIANAGDKVDLECVAAGVPTPNVEWYYGGSYYTGQKDQIQRGEKRVRQISFANVNLVNTGEYTCQARNGALDGNGDVIEVKKTINLFVRSPPQINEEASPTPVYSFVGNRKSVDVTCTFFGYPVPTVIMRDENGTEIAQGNSTVSYTISYTTKDDFGTFNCTAESPDGMAQYLVELRKAVPPGPPRDVTTNKTCKEITLMWKRPFDNGGMEIASYIITVLSEGNKLYTENVGGFTVEHNIGYSFTPKTKYEIRVQARNEVGPGAEEQLFVETDEFCVPGKPRITNTELEVDVEDFIVTWSAPLYNGGDDNLKYRLEWRMKPITDDTEEGIEDNIAETQFKITGLEHSEEYEVKLFSINQQGLSEADIKTFKTKPNPANTTSPSKSSGKATVLTTPSAIDPKVGARTAGLGSGAIAGIVIAVILIVLITIDLFCCFFNSCGIIFCCHRAICGVEGGVTGGKDDYKDGKATEMEKKPLPENV